MLFFIVFKEAPNDAELVHLEAGRPNIQLQFTGLKRGLSVITEQGLERMPEEGNLARKKRKRTRVFCRPRQRHRGRQSHRGRQNSDGMRQFARCEPARRPRDDDKLRGNWAGAG